MPLLARVAAALRSLPANLGRESSRAYIPELDGLRFLAIMFVLVWHSALRAARYIDHLNAAGAHLTTWFTAFPHGEVGVILFFFISGFVVSQPFVAKPRQSWRIGDFYKRRFMRIYPPYLIVMSLCFLVLGVLHHTPVDAYAYQYATVPLDQSFLASLVYLHGIVFDSPSRLNPPMWSLEIEVAFYAILPPLMLLYCAGRKGGRPRRADGRRDRRRGRAVEPSYPFGRDRPAAALGPVLPRLPVPDGHRRRRRRRGSHPAPEPQASRFRPALRGRALRDPRHRLADDAERRAHGRVASTPSASRRSRSRRSCWSFSARSTGAGPRRCSACRGYG